MPRVASAGRDNNPLCQLRINSNIKTLLSSTDLKKVIHAFISSLKLLRLSPLSKMFSYIQFIKNSVGEGFSWCHLSKVL